MLNKSIVRIVGNSLARELGFSRSHVAIEKGGDSRLKILRVCGLWLEGSEEERMTPA
jgi:uncharacterized protein YggU (UPF0235/DUF167 family)